MGGVIVSDPWLTTMLEPGTKGAKVAATLIRMQILQRRRTGHVIELSTEYLRRRITHAARWGHVAECMVACSECGTQAHLTDWVATAEYRADERKALLEGLRRKMGAEYLAYLRKCPGKEWADLVAQSEMLPKGR